MEALDEPYTQIGFWTMIRKRGGWLAILFVGEMLTAWATGAYARELEAMLVLSLLMPLIISSGGNSGSQATSLIIRAMALNEIGLRDWFRVAMRELPAGLTLGAGLGAIGFSRIVVWHSLGLGDKVGCEHYMLVGTVIWLSVIGVVTFGTLAGSMLPFILRRFRLDPASASAPFVATLVDVMGLVIYFNIASVVLSGVVLCKPIGR